MFKNLRTRWASEIQAWTLDRTTDQLEGERLLNEGEFPEAELHLAKAMVESEKRRDTAQQRVQIRLHLAEAQRRQSDGNNPNPLKLAAAEETLRSALELASRSGDRPSIIQCLDGLADVFADRGDMAEVERLTREANQTEATLAHANPLWMAQRAKRFGDMCAHVGRFNEAVLELERAVAILEKSFGRDHVATANHLSELGAAYRAQGNDTAAEKCLRQALRVHERVHGIEAPESLHDMHELTATLETLGDIEGASALHERLLTLKLRVVGGDLDEIAELQTGLAGLYMRWKRYSRARELLLEAIGTFKRKRGARLAQSYEMMAELERECGHHHETLRQLELAGRVWETTQPDHVAELIENLEQRATLFEQLRQNREAAYYREKAGALKKADKWATAS